ncbi:MAG: hypothetical protein PVI67_06405, partial [Anaerolineae bacterium]
MDEQTGRIAQPVSAAILAPSPDLQRQAQDQRLRMIFALAKILVSEDDQETMLARFLSGLINSTEAADAGSLWLYDANDDCLAAV